MLRRSLLGLTGLTALAAAAAWPWVMNAGDPPALAAEAGALVQRDLRLDGLRGMDAARARDVARDFGLGHAPVVVALEAGDAAPAALDGTVTRTRAATAAQAELTADELKALTKLEKKLTKALAKIEKQELKLASLADQLSEAEAALDAAQLLPEGTANELKAKAKAIAKALKQIAKLEGKLDKGQEKLDSLEAGEETLTAQIEVIDPEHFAGIVGLQAPEQMAVVTADAEEGGEGSGFFGGGDFLLGGEDFPLLSDYNQDDQHSFVFDPSMETLSTVNMILSMLSQTAYDEMVNAGTYVAQIDESLAESGGDTSASGSETGQSSGGNAEAPQLWVVKSQRPTDESSQIVKFWVPQEAGEDGPGSKSGAIWAEMEVFEGISEQDPFGRFNLNFAMVPVGGTVEDAGEHGNLRTLEVLDGFIGFSFYMTKGDLTKAEFAPGEHAETVQANVNMFDDQSEGVARIRRQWRENHGPEGDTGVQTDEFLLAFNDQTVLRGKNGEQGICLSRTDFEERVFRYSLYEAQGENLGQRVDRDGGFGFKTEDGKYGWIGYYGMWAPPDVEIENGDTVTKSVFGNQQEAETYTVVQAPGKLIRSTRQQLPLAEADGEEFTWWDFPAPPPPPGGGDPPPGGGEGGDPPPGGGDPPPGGGDPPPGGGEGGGDPQGGGGPTTPPSQYRVVYDHGGGLFLRVAEFDMETQQFAPLETPEAIDIEAHGNFLQMYSESLGGPVSYVLGDETLTYFQQEFVTGSDEVFGEGDALMLYGYVECLGAGITGEDATNGDVFLDKATEVELPHVYAFDRTDLTLYLVDGETLAQVGLADGEEPSGGPFSWGMRSGPMVLSTEGLQNPYEVWNQPVFYTYETGHNTWNKYQSLVDVQGAHVAFDPPLQFTYEHAAENDRNGEDFWGGKKFLLNYNGPGDLHGIPHQGLDLDDDGHPDRFYPVFSMADGVLCGPTGTEYVLKALDVELTLGDAPGQCQQTIGPVAGLPLPDETWYSPPDIGPKPFVDDAPAVITGEVVESGAP
jgi:hypothetical protein